MTFTTICVSLRKLAGISAVGKELAMVRIKLAGAAMSAMRDVPAMMVAGPSKACSALKLVNADVVRMGAMRGAEVEGGHLALAGKGALARGAEAEGARLVGMTKMATAPTGLGAVKAGKMLALSAPGKVVVTKAAATGASLWGSGLSLGLGLGAGALGPLLLLGALGAIGFGIYLGVSQEPTGRAPAAGQGPVTA